MLQAQIAAVILGIHDSMQQRARFLSYILQYHIMAKATAQIGVPDDKTVRWAYHKVAQERILGEKQIGQHERASDISSVTVIAVSRKSKGLHICTAGKDHDWSSGKTFLASPQRQASLTGVLRNATALSFTRRELIGSRKFL